MKKASITEAKNRLSALLERVKQGESILITERNVPIARLEPATRSKSAADEVLSSLERRGIVNLAQGKVAKRIFAQKPPKLKGSLLAELLQERETGR